MFSLKQFSLAVATLAATVTVSALCSTAAQAAIVGGRVSGTWQYDFDGAGGFNVGDTFTADYTYDDANVTTTDSSNSYNSRYLTSTVPLLSLILNSGSVTQTFDLSTSISNYLYSLDIQQNPIYGQYEEKQNRIYVLDSSAPGQNYFTAQSSFGKYVGGSPFANYYAQGGSYNFTTRTDVTGAYTYAPVTFSATAVPTPALLPGLIGLGVSVLRKRKA